MGAATQVKSFDDLCAEIRALPPGMTGEILGPGWLRTMSRPEKRHRAGNKRLAGVLHGVSREAGGAWWIEQEAEIRFGPKLYVPDLAGWRLSGDDDLAFLDANPITRSPDWVCEMLSRSTQKADRVIKLPTYAASGVRHAWIADPDALTVEVYETTERGPTLVGAVRGDETARLPPFDLPICPDGLFSIR
jgi:Uma2 family endonuclease